MKPSGNSQAGFTAIELIVGMLLLSLATGSMLVVGKGLRDNSTAAASASQQNAYATFQSQVALQGINPSLVGNPLSAAIQQAGSVGTAVSLGANTALAVVRDQVAGFEVAAVSTPGGAQRNLAGSARVDAVDYSVAAAGAQTARGTGIGFAVELTGTPPAVNAIPLAPPSFNVVGDLTYALFPLNNIATLPSTNPPGTVYRYTLDGTAPNAGSLIWDNNPGWQAGTFPAQVTLGAFNTDPDYAPSVPVLASYSMQLILGYGRADGRTNNLYGFSLTDLTSAAATGIVLTSNVSNQPLLYTLDGSDPTVNGTLYTGPFVPAQAQFAPNVTLRIAAVPTDSRYATPGISTYTLTTIATALAAPTFVTSNAVPLSPGTDVVLSVTGSGSPRTEVNNGAPSMGSSSASQFPLQ
jgi:type II secretory pathway pseudopilin PulG